MPSISLRHVIFPCLSDTRGHFFSLCRRRYSGLARNLIRRIFSPNQDDLSYSFQISFPGQQKLGKLPNTASSADNTDQCRRPIGRS